MNIIEAPLPKGQFYPTKFQKKNIVLHHTVSSTAKSTLDWWRMDPKVIGTAYVIHKDGTIYRTFPDECWAHHLGLTTRNNTARNRQSIGIELVNEGLGFTNNRDIELHWMKPQGPIYRGATTKMEWRLAEGTEGKTRWKAGTFWPNYPDAQVEACALLVDTLLGKYNLPRTMAMPGIYDPTVPDRCTIYAHHHVRKDKTDVSPAFPWQRLHDFLGLQIQTA